ncbi:MAG TPA: hypothetical protein VM925_08760 [Labilithrix sp.]|nr:hypothetical protein [Labilithrix sp.]
MSHENVDRQTQRFEKYDALREKGICTETREDEGRIAAAAPMLDAIHPYFVRNKGDRE